jgi:hypothetical protein
MKGAHDDAIMGLSMALYAADMCLINYKKRIMQIKQCWNRGQCLKEPMNQTKHFILMVHHLTK